MAEWLDGCDAQGERKGLKGLDEILNDVDFKLDEAPPETGQATVKRCYRKDGKRVWLYGFDIGTALVDIANELGFRTVEEAVQDNGISSTSNNDTPQDIKKRYLELRKRYEEKFKESISSGQKIPDQDEMNRIWNCYAEKFEEQAKRKWNEYRSRRNDFEGAWSYSLAAYFYDKAQNPQEASANYHYAANGFRNAGSLNQAIIHYQESFRTAGDNDSWKKRNQNHISALKKMTGEDDN